MRIVMFILLPTSILNVYGVDFLVQKCCPRGFSYNFKAGKCDRNNDRLLDWVPNQLRNQELLSNRLQFRYVLPTLEEMDKSLDPCPVFLQSSTQPVFINRTTPLKLKINETAITVDKIVLNNWCIDSVTGSQPDEKWILISCNCLHHNCISVCCNPGYRLKIHKFLQKTDSSICSDRETTVWKPQNAADLVVFKNDLKPRQFRNFTLYEFLTSCLVENGKIRRPKRIESFQIDATGILTSKRYKLNRWSYCITESLVQGTPRTVAMHCDPSEVATTFKDATNQSIFAAIGAAFTLLTFLIHVVVKDLRQGIKGLSLISHCACMLGAYLTMAFRPLAWDRNSSQCTVLGVFTHFFLLSAFYWLNVRAITIYATFRSWNSMLSGLSTDIKSFPLYSLYAFGVPALISSFMAWVQFSEEEDLPYWIEWPDLDEASCWFRSSIGRALYFSLPMGIVLVFNVCLFITTLLKILSFKKENVQVINAVGNTSEKSICSDMERFKLFAKLSLLMGLTYISELLAWMNYFFYYYWYVTNVAFVLRSLLIFIFFCCRRKVWISMSKQYPIMKRYYDNTDYFIRHHLGLHKNQE